MLDHFQMGPNLVRGFASNGIGPRDINYYSLGATGDALGGTKYWGASAELQMLLAPAQGGRPEGSRLRRCRRYGIIRARLPALQPEK